MYIQFVQDAPVHFVKKKDLDEVEKIKKYVEQEIRATDDRVCGVDGNVA